MANRIVIDNDEIDYDKFYVGDRTLTLDSTTKISKIKIKDGITYDLTNSDQNTAYNLAYNTTDGWMLKLTLTKHLSNGYREYKANNIGTISHPLNTDFGYSDLKSGSIIQDVVAKKTYIYEEISNTWTEQ